MGRSNEKKQSVAAIHLRLRPSIKAMAVRMAQEDKCSMAEWLERLIEAEAARLEGEKVRGGGGRTQGGVPRRRLSPFRLILKQRRHSLVEILQVLGHDGPHDGRINPAIFM